MNKKRMASAVLAALLMVMPVLALGQETAPLGAWEQAQENDARERLSVFGMRRSYKGVRASSAWMWQAKIGGSLLNLRMFTAHGEQLVFQQKLSAAQTGGEEDIRLALRVNAQDEVLLMQLDQAALDTLDRLGVTEIVVADTDMYVFARYLTQDLLKLRSAFSLGESELLCVSGEQEPVTVVSVDGVRRQITQ